MSKSILGGVAALSLVVVAACGSATSDAEAIEAKSTANAIFGPVTSGTYSLDKGHGYITMTYDHQGYSKPYIRFVGFDAELNLNVESPLESSVTVDIDPATIDTGVPAFDDHLKSADIFDVATHSEISFVSTKLEMTGDKTGKMTGDLTMKGITKPVTLDVVLNKADFYKRGNTNKIGFSAKASLMRSEWDLGFAVPFVGDQVDLIIETEFLQK